MLHRFFKGWNWFELTFLTVGIVLPVVFGIVFNLGMLATIATVIFLMAVTFQAKGKVYGYVLGIIGMVLYGIVSFNSGLYGEVIIAVAISSPIMLYGIINWARNLKRGEAQVIIRKTPPLEFAVVITSQIILGGGYFFILRAFGTELLILSTISVSATIIGEILFARRTHIGTGAFFLNDVAGIVLWSFVLANGGTYAIAMIVMWGMTLVMDIYGLIEWRKMYKAQNELGGF